MKRATIGIGAICSLVALVGALIPWTLSDHSIRNQIARQIRETTGLTMDPPSRMAFALLPRPLIKLENVTVHDRRGAFLVQAPVMKGDLRLISLLTGRIELSSISLFEPTMTVNIDGRPLIQKGALARASVAAPASAQAVLADAARLAVLRVVSGRILIRSPSRGFDASFRHVNANLDWPRLNAPASFSATGDWRGQSGSLTAWVGSPAAWLRGGTSQLALLEKSSICSIKLDGALAAGSDWRFRGQTSASTPSLSAFTAWLNDEASLPRAFGRASFTARAVADKTALAFDNLRLSLGNSDFEGSAALRSTATRPLISATLATDSLSLAPYLAELPKTVGYDGLWSHKPLAKSLGPLDLDLRISASKANLGRVEFSDLGMAVLLENGRLRFDMPEAKVYGGTLKARAIVAPAGGVQSLRASASFANIDAAALLWAASGFDRLSGTASGQFSVQSNGVAIADLMRGLVGTAKFSLSKGEFLGIDLERALRRIDTRPLSVAEEVHGGGTSFDTFSGALSFANDKAELQNVVLTGPGAQMTFKGDALLGERTLHIAAQARQAGSDGKVSPNGSHLNMKIRGFWNDPRLVLNAARLVRRSEAAAPLFQVGDSPAPGPR